MGDDSDTEANWQKWLDAMYKTDTPADHPVIVATAAFLQVCVEENIMNSDRSFQVPLRRMT